MIETQGLSKRFGTNEAVHDLNLRVAEGSAVALVGANGAGKTTTIRLLMNLLRPDAGSAQVLGVEARQLGPEQRQRIGYVSENLILPGGLRLADWLRYLRSLYPSWDTALEASLLDALQLPLQQRIAKLSHGMRMKAQLLAALAFRPALLVLDEPLSGLDPLVRDQLLENILGQAEGTTILISSHELIELEGAVTDIAFMAKGRLLFQEPIERLVDRFRDVRVSLPNPPPSIQAGTPSAWLAPRLEGRTFAFIDSAFENEAELSASVRQLFGEASQIDISPMSLRSIAKVLIQESNGGRAA